MLSIDYTNWKWFLSALNLFSPFFDTRPMVELLSLSYFCFFDVFMFTFDYSVFLTSEIIYWLAMIIAKLFSSSSNIFGWADRTKLIFWIRLTMRLSFADKKSIFFSKIKSIISAHSGSILVQDSWIIHSTNSIANDMFSNRIMLLAGGSLLAISAYARHLGTLTKERLSHMPVPVKSNEIE